MRALVAVIFAGPLLVGQGVEPRAKATDYPVHAALPKLALGAEYMVHSFAGQGEMFFAEDYLVVEVALYPARGESLGLTASQFTLRLNGKKQLLFSQSAGFVAASLKYPDWERRRNLEVEAGSGNASVILGRPEVVDRFPGDRRRQDTRLPAPPTAPPVEDRSGLEKHRKPSAAEVVTATALREGTVSHAVAGYLYFAWRGKTKSIRTLELLYTTDDDKAVLRLCCHSR